MDIRQLRYFLRIVEAGSFSKASETLRIAQPSLSHHVRELEEELGVELLTRHARGVVPTDFGFLLCDHARVILREVSRTKERIRDAADSIGGEVLVGLSTATCRGLAVPLTRAVAAEYPRISVHLVEAMSGSLYEWVQAGRLDVVLSYESKSTENLLATEVISEELRLILPADHPLAGERTVPFSKLANLRLVLPALPHIIRRVIERNFAIADLELSNVINCDSMPAIVQLVRHGYATLLPSFGVSDEIGRGELAAVQVVEPTPTWQLSIVLSRKCTNSRAAKVVAKILHQVASRLVQQGVWPAQLKVSRARGRLSTNPERRPHRPEPCPANVGTAAKETHLS
jgi:LysR family transcriptional regulator, nitrogen assimilation regulatory protein